MSKKAYEHILQHSKKKNPDLHKTIKSIGPIRIILRNKTDLPTLLCRSIAGQQLSVKAASTIWGRLQHQAEGKDVIRHIRQTQPDVIRTCGLSAAKTKAMFAVAEAKSQGLLNVNKLKKMDMAKRNQTITSIWGVGDWTANMLNIFYFGEKDIWPDKDVVVRKKFISLTKENSDSIQESEIFSPYRSYLAMYMWRYADAKPA